MASGAMNATADRFASQGIGSIFLYTNEAHPGETFPHLTSMEQKFRHAQALSEVYGVTRPILVDSLNGACHRAYGSMPNMTWMFNKHGTILYKSDWTDSLSVDNAIEYFLQVANRRRNGARLSPFKVQRLEYRESDRYGFYDGLARNGAKAVTEFEETFPGSQPKDWTPKTEDAL